MSKVIEGENLIEVKDISYSVDNEQILDSISLNVPKGDYLGLIGPNGAGKTTLLKIILSLLKPNSGEIKLFNQELPEFKDWPKIGYVPQKATKFESNFPATVIDVVLMGRTTKRSRFHFLTSEDKKLAEEALAQVGLENLKDQLIGNLSGGQEQRVFIARALIAKPEILFLDEPTTGVDKKTSGEFYALLKNLNQKCHLTIVLISHDLEMIIKETKHVAYIDKALLCFDKASEFAKHSQFSHLFEGNWQMITHKHH